MSLQAVKALQSIARRSFSIRFNTFFVFNIILVPKIIKIYLNRAALAGHGDQGSGVGHVIFNYKFELDNFQPF